MSDRLLTLRRLKDATSIKWQWRSDGRLIYGHGDTPIGMMDESEDAALIVGLVNSAQDLIDAAWALRLLVGRLELNPPPGVDLDSHKRILVALDTDG